MSGIAGIAFNDPVRQADKQMLSRMTAIMRHRGPDGDAFHWADGAGLAMCHLNIRDAATGDGPIANEDGPVVVICNGEIYNYIELRERLQSKGHRFRTQSDAEVIVHLYEDNPDGFLSELRGMFAFALWDAKRRRLLLARDRLGIKPLHYALTAQGLVFGSELKTILAAGLVTPRLDGRGLKDVFTVGFVRAPHTMVADVSRLLPGQYLLFEAGQMTTKLYWDVSFPDRCDYDRHLTADQWADALREQLAESVRLRLRGDGPVGSWLSGGIDSSAVTALMHRELRQPIHTFTLGFENRGVDELEQNRLLDEYPAYQLVGHRTRCGREHFDLLPKAVWHREQPMRVGADIPGILISAFTAKHLKVVVTGDGADALLGGSPWYRANKILSPFSALPRPVRRMAARCLSGRWRGAARILKSPAPMNPERFDALAGLSPKCLPQDLFADGLVPAGEEPEALSLPDAFHRWHPFAQLQYLDIKLRFSNAIILTTDLLTTAYSLEARVPFLDDAFVEFCARIPPWVKMRGLQGKYVLRRAMRDILPPEICRRRKFAMSAPTRDWMAGALPEFAIPLLSEQSLRDKGYFNPCRVAALVAEHQAGQKDHSRLLLAILSTQLWDDLFLKRFLCATT